MSSDIKINGEAYMPRRNQSIWGTFYTTVEPPISGSRVGILETTWGSRMAEMSGKVRGISSFGTLPKEGTLTISFPHQFFNYDPIVSVVSFYEGFLPDLPLAAPNSDPAEKARWYTLTQGMWYYHTGQLYDWSYLGNPYINNYPASVGILIRAISPTGFKICHHPEIFTSNFSSSGYSGKVNNKEQIIAWHAFGC